MEKWRKRWIDEKKDIAIKLNSGKCGGSYAESVIILCSALSALASEVWPGQKKDKVRFVELLKEFAPEKYKVTNISIPLLITYLKDKKRGKEAEIIREAYLNISSAIVITDSVDKSEKEIMQVCNTLGKKELRDHSYASLLYSEVRCGYAHEYKTGKQTDPWPMTRQDTFISYVNWACKPDRHIHFHLAWIAEMASSIAEKLDNIEDTLPKKDPKWWVNGNS